MKTYLFVTTFDHEEYEAEPLRGKTLAEAVKDAESIYYNSSMYQQDFDGAWIVEKSDFEDYDFEAWKDYVDFFRRPFLWADGLGAEVIGKVYIESTGGGIYIAYLYTTEHIYYVVDSDGCCFGKYDDTEEFHEGMCMDALEIGDYPSEWTAEENQIYGRLTQALKDNGTYWGDLEDNTAED